MLWRIGLKSKVALALAAELWIFLGAPLDRGGLAAKLKMSERLAHYFPTNAVIVRRVAYLAFDGQAVEARKLLLHAMQSFPHLCKATVLILEQSLAADRNAIEPLLALARARADPTAAERIMSSAGPVIRWTLLHPAAMHTMQALQSLKVISWPT
jgi:hypothetical protein